MPDSRNEELGIHNEISRMIKSQNLILKAEGREAFGRLDLQPRMYIFLLRRRYKEKMQLKPVRIVKKPIHPYLGTNTHVSRVSRGCTDPWALYACFTVPGYPR